MLFISRNCQQMLDNCKRNGRLTFKSKYQTKLRFILSTVLWQYSSFVRRRHCCWKRECKLDFVKPYTIYTQFEVNRLVAMIVHYKTWPHNNNNSVVLCYRVLEKKQCTIKMFTINSTLVHVWKREKKYSPVEFIIWLSENIGYIVNIRSHINVYEDIL